MILTECASCTIVSKEYSRTQTNTVNKGYCYNGRLMHNEKITGNYKLKCSSLSW